MGKKKSKKTPWWFVKLDPPEFRVPSRPFGVWMGGFRDSTHASKWLAEQRRDKLNNSLL